MYSSSSSGKRDFRADLFIKLKRRFCCPLRLGSLDVEITARTHGEASQTWLFGFDNYSKNTWRMLRLFSPSHLRDHYLLENGRKVFCEKVRIPFLKFPKAGSVEGLYSTA